LTWEAWERTFKSIDLNKGFTDIGYTWKDNAMVSPRTLPGYVYDPNEESSLELDGDDDENAQNQIANDTNLANQEHTRMALKNGGKQLKLAEVWTN
jgi:hypothetical protein